MSCLDIDQQREFSDNADLPDPLKYGIGRFAYFVNGLLMFHKAPLLDTFRFHVARCNFGHPIDPWIRRGIKCCPVVLEICLPYYIDHPSYVVDPKYELPPLGSSSWLCLVGIRLHKNFTLHLRSGCPALEDLELKRCHVAYPEIISCTLRNLTIEDCTTYWSNVLTVKTRALISFRLVIISFEWYGIIVDEMPSLVKASICFKYHPCGSTLREGSCKLLGSLTNVRNLELFGSETLLILHEGSDSFPVFYNIRILMFDGCDLSDKFQILAPSLERLILRYCKFAEGSNKRKRRETLKMTSLKRQNILTFECPDLKWTEIEYKDGDVNKLYLAFCLAFGGTYRRVESHLLKAKGFNFSLLR